MSTLAEIEAAADELSSDQKEQLMKFLASRLERKVSGAQAVPEVRLLAKDLQIKPGIDLNKLGQLVEDF